MPATDEITDTNEADRAKENKTEGLTNNYEDNEVSFVLSEANFLNTTLDTVNVSR